MTNPFDSAGAKAPPKPFTVTEGRREIRSFVLRQGRFTPAQQRAFDERWPRFGIDFNGEPRDLDATFGRAAPKVLEIGFGNGAALRHAARFDPSKDYIGIEVHAPGVGRLLNALADDDAGNVKLYHHDAVDVLDATPGLVNRACPRGSVPRPDWRPQTHFETRGQKLGHGVWDIVYDKTGMGTGE